MGVAGGRLRLRMPEELADNREARDFAPAPIDANVCRKSCNRTPSSPARRHTADQGFFRSVRGRSSLPPTITNGPTRGCAFRISRAGRFNTIVFRPVLESGSSNRARSSSRRAPSASSNLSQSGAPVTFLQRGAAPDTCRCKPGIANRHVRDKSVPLFAKPRVDLLCAAVVKGRRNCSGVAPSVAQGQKRARLIARSWAYTIENIGVPERT